MKKFLTILLSITIIMTMLVGCSKDSNKDTEITSDTDVTIDLETSEEPTITYETATYENSSWISRIDWSGLTDLEAPVTYTRKNISIPTTNEEIRTLYKTTDEKENDIVKMELYNFDVNDSSQRAFVCDDDLITKNTIDGIIDGEVHKVTPIMYISSVDSDYVSFTFDILGGSTVEIENDNAETNEANVEILENYIRNYLGKPDYIYCVCDVDDVTTYNNDEGLSNIVVTNVIWQYDDGSVIKITGHEMAYDDGVHLKVSSIYYSATSGLFSGDMGTYNITDQVIQ